MGDAEDSQIASLVGAYCCNSVRRPTPLVSVLRPQKNKDKLINETGGGLFKLSVVPVVCGG